MKIKRNTKIIPVSNPNFEIDDLISMIKYIPIIIFENEEEKIIGFVDKESNFHCDKNFIYGDIIYISEEYINCEFINYSCHINEGIIKKFYYIEFKKENSIMKINVSTNEKFNRIEIVKSNNSNYYQICINGKYKNNEFNFDCGKCENVELSFDILEDGKMMISESEGNKS